MRGYGFQKAISPRVHPSPQTSVGAGTVKAMQGSGEVCRLRSRMGHTGIWGREGWKGGVGGVVSGRTARRAKPNEHPLDPTP